MHPAETVKTAFGLAAAGELATRIARRVGVPRRTVSDWLTGRVPGQGGERGERSPLRPEDLPDEYVYLLGLYLGDGCLSPHARGLFRLRIVLDARYPAIIAECMGAIETVRPRSKVNARRRPHSRAVDVSSYWKEWPTLFPQHAPGRKHERRIVLAPWQQTLVDEYPELLLRGLSQSDGCRSANSGRGGWRHPRYSFSNRSADIRRLFCAAYERLAVHWTSAPHTIYVSRKDDVALLDEFVGPKA